MTLYYKCLAADGKGPSSATAYNLPKGKRPGKWMPKVELLDPCKSGYHVCELQDLPIWVDAKLYLCEGRGESLRANDKTLFQQVRLVRELTAWNERSARLFACDCSDRALARIENPDPRSIKAIRIARLYAEGHADKEELSAAESAAWSAAESAESAARSAAWSVEYSWQAKRLAEILGVEEESE